MSRRLMPVLIVFGVILAGCEDVTPAPPPELVEGVDYIEGAAEVPTGKYLLVEFITEINPRGDGPLYLDLPFYKYENGTLSGYVSYPDEYDSEQPIIGYFGQCRMPAPGSGYGAYSALIAFQSLPFQHPDQPGVVLSIDGEGTIVADVNGEVVELRVDDSWSYSDVGEATCIFRGWTCENTLINRGFLVESQINLGVRD